MKFLLFIAILSLHLFANITFKETRYVSALDFERELYGNLIVSDEVMTISYTKPIKETIIYHTNKLIILRGDDKKEIMFEDYPQAKYMGLILKAIINSEYESLNELFTIKKKGLTIDLEAKPAIANEILLIEILKNDKNSIKTIKINMSNDDKITIETTD